MFTQPVELILDNGLAFIFDHFTQFYNQYNIEHSNSSTYHPQGNDLVESTNKNLIRILKKSSMCASPF